MEMSNELLRFKEHFEINTNIRVHDVYEHYSCYHWKRLLFHELNSEQLEIIGRYLKKTFYSHGKSSHLLPKIQTWGNDISITIDVNLINQFIPKIRL
jgi:hypothetical protein